MKIELGFTMWEGCWQECAFWAYEVEAPTTLPGEVGKRPEFRRYVLAGEQWLRQRLSFRVWELRDLADRLEQACEERIQVAILGDLHNLERRRRAGFARTSGAQMSPRANHERGKRARVTQRGLLP